MRHTILALLLAAAAPAALAAPVPKEQLLVPPKDAAHYVVVSEAGKHGDMWRWTLPDGRTAYRHSQSLRGWISETDQVARYGANGIPTTVEVRGITPNGDAAETLAVADGKATWKSTADSGTVNAGKAVYIPAGGVPLSNEAIVNALASGTEAGVDLLPSGHASIKRGTTLTINGPSGPKQVQLAFVRGILAAPVPVWLDDKGKYFAEVSYLSYFPAGYESPANMKAMREAQEAATAAEVKAIAKQFLTAEAKAPVLFDNVRLFDADKGAFVENQAVLLRDGKIASIGGAGSIPAGGVRVIDGKGKTLVPGIWDSHMHIGDDWDVLANMANGMTSFRSPGTTLERAKSAVVRRASGDLLMGEPFIQAIVDQKHPLAAQGSMTVSSEAETIAAVREIKNAGLWGVKFYTSMTPGWIAPGAAEAHKLGLHVHGHIPAGMRPLDAVRAGYDEITHINFIIMQAMPQAVVDKANTAARLEGPAKYGKDVDLDSPEMKAFYSELAKRKTIIDPTLTVWEPLLTSDGSVMSPEYSPFADIAPPAVARGWKISGYPLFDGLTRADFRKSFDKMVGVVGRLHQAGVTIVAGTDGYGLELVRELELYQQAGLTNVEALQTATIIPARMTGMDDRTGSITNGKTADLILVNGDVSKDLGNLRHVDTVFLDGYRLDGGDLRKAAGFTGMPK